jgi:hypothetical protein
MSYPRALGALASALLGALALAAPASAAINPSAFTTRITNQWLPFPAGTTFHFTGEVDGKSSTDTETVTSDTSKKLDGVRTRRVHDEVAVKGKVIEKTEDYYAQNTKTGDVWYFGEDAYDLKGSKFVLAPDSWHAGENGAKPGILQEANPKVGDTYQQEDAPGVAEDRAKVLSLNESVTVPYGSFNHVLETKETSPLDPQSENKWYAKGVGELKEAVADGSEHYELVSITH